MNLQLNHETLLRLAVFSAVLLAMLFWEWRAPKRAALQQRSLRRMNNLALGAVNALALRALPAIAATGAAAAASGHGWGLFNVAAFPHWVGFAACVLLLDLGIYAQHVAFHRFAPLWRMHRVHHSDRDVDVTTGLRFHPFEILLSMIWKAVLVIAFGAPLSAVLAFEILLNATAMFNHGNVRVASGMDRILRRVVVTPDMHRVHHSVRREETDSNYGFCLSWWDRLFRTYRDQPALGHAGMRLGLSEFPGPGTVNLLWLLVQPFRNFGKPAARE